MEREEWSKYFISNAPKVNLKGIGERTDYNHHIAIGAAGSCYRSKIMEPEEAEIFDQKLDLQRSIWGAGHHTPFMHKTYIFTIEGVSRHALWEFFHAHPFYNSEQVSQRYRKIDQANMVMPNLPEKAKNIFGRTIERQKELYDLLRNDLLVPVASEAYFARFSGRRNSPQEQLKRYEGEIRKKTQEIARYVLPIGTTAHLYHSINAVTLARYQKLANMPETREEVKYITDQMIQLVLERDPSFQEILDGSIDRTQLLEERLLQEVGLSTPEEIYEWRTEFDTQLKGKNTALIDYKPYAVHNLAQSIRDMLAIPERKLPDAEAIRLLFDPKINQYQGATLTLDHVEVLTRAQYLPHFTFAVKLSHTADSQAQRQRMSPATRPILSKTITNEPEYITPALIKIAGSQAREIYERGMQEIWDARNKLIDLGVEPRIANYLLPNATTIRYQEMVDLLNFRQKDTKRECLNAQEEIGKITLEQRLEIERVHPELKGIFGPPCVLRARAKQKPICPEGKRFCGIPVWKGEENAIEEVMPRRVI